MPESGQQIHTHGYVIDGDAMNMGYIVNFDDDNDPATKTITRANDNIEQIFV